MILFCLLHFAQTRPMPKNQKKTAKKMKIKAEKPTHIFI